MNDTPKRTWSEEKVAIEVWKYYGGIGGADKDTMIKIVTWLLGFSTTIIGVYATGKLTDSFATVLLIVLGTLVSILAAFTALLYGGYAAWNWAIADKIAMVYEWAEQKPDYIPIPRSETHWTSAFPLRLAKPCQNRIAPIFWVFFFVSLVSLGVHVVLLLHVASS
ncbi:MAG TPA: hypothetical protein VN687_13695 [Blastocatellia bacterium]|nr:hypothetical protein [Blastocatellia bacterium]